MTEGIHKCLDVERCAYSLYEVKSSTGLSERSSCTPPMRVLLPPPNCNRRLRLFSTQKTCHWPHTNNSWRKSAETKSRTISAGSIDTRYIKMLRYL